MAKMTRRDLLRTATAVGLAAATAGRALGQTAPVGPAPATGAPAPAGGTATAVATAGNVPVLNVAIIGAGDHGRQLIFQCMKLPGLRFRAVCDIWDYSRDYAARLLRKYKHPVSEYIDYRDMLAKEKGLDAVIIASPDGFHAEQAIACLAAGAGVYLEKEMALTIADCRRIVQAAGKAGKCLQVGRQHRSNLRYVRALEYVDVQKALGRITHVAAQWHGHRRDKVTWLEKFTIDKARLAEYGFDSMEQFCNWRYFAKFAPGEMASLGSHQIDVFNWFLHALPMSVYAAGGRDYYDYYELYDNISGIYEWDYDWSARKTKVRGTYEINNTTEMGGFFETFTGSEGELQISEIATRGGLWRDVTAPLAPWEEQLQARAVKEYGPQAYGPIAFAEGGGPPQPTYGARAYGPIPAQDSQSVYWHHLRNFFNAIRGTEKLTCPGEVGFAAAVACLKASESMKLGKRLELKIEDYKV